MIKWKSLQRYLQKKKTAEVRSHAYIVETKPRFICDPFMHIFERTKTFYLCLYWWYPDKKKDKTPVFSSAYTQALLGNFVCYGAQGTLTSATTSLIDGSTESVISRAWPKLPEAAPNPTLDSIPLLFRVKKCVQSYDIHSYCNLYQSQITSTAL